MTSACQGNTNEGLFIWSRSACNLQPSCLVAPKAPCMNGYRPFVTLAGTLTARSYKGLCVMDATQTSCLYCGTPIEPLHYGLVKYCSTECFRRAKAERETAKAEQARALAQAAEEAKIKALRHSVTKTTARVCPQCGELFVANNSRTVHCSPECARAAYTRDAFVIFDRDGFRCAYCGRTSYEHEVVLHIDHVLPRVAGGKDIAGNLITACSRCNTAKGRKQLQDQAAVLEEVARRNKRVGLSDRQTIKIAGREFLPAETGDLPDAVDDSTLPANSPYLDATGA